MSKNGSKGRKNRERAAAAAAAEADVDRCECGWELPIVGLRCDDPSNRPASFRGMVLTYECPICGHSHEERLIDPRELTAETLRIRCNASILDSSRLPLSATSLTSPLSRKAA
jgi:hypothetical protein